MHLSSLELKFSKKKKTNKFELRTIDTLVRIRVVGWLTYRPTLPASSHSQLVKYSGWISDITVPRFML